MSTPLQQLAEADDFLDDQTLELRIITGEPPFKVYKETIAQAQSGTGKTATFAISVLQKLDLSLNQCQALILAPTRELAVQIQTVVIALGDYMKTNIHACVGGTAVREDIRILSQGVHIVVGTPGRVYDMISRGALRLDHCKIFCLDEADEMLSRGFKDQIYDVFKNVVSNNGVKYFTREIVIIDDVALIKSDAFQQVRILVSNPKR